MNDTTAPCRRSLCVRGSEPFLRGGRHRARHEQDRRGNQRERREDGYLRHQRHRPSLLLGLGVFR